MPKNGLIDLYRFIFVFVVVLLHSGFGFSRGYGAVEFFFILAGFFLAVKMSKNSLCAGEYFLSRLKRLYPAFFVSLCLAFVIRAILWGFYDAEFPETVNIVLDFLMLGSLFETMNAPAWFLTALILAQTLVVFARKIDNFYIFALFGAIFIYANLMWQFGHLDMLLNKEWCFEGFYFSGGFWRALAGVLLGCAIFGVFERIKGLKFNPNLVFIFELIIFILALILLASDHRRTMSDILAPIIFSALILLAFLPQPKFIARLNHKFVHFLGALSLSLYLSHYTAFVLLRKALNDQSSGLLFASLIITALILALIVHFLSKRLSKFASKKFQNLV